jgi:hypothetical protein
MITAFQAFEESEEVVFESFTLTRAAVACGQLEASGLPARLGRVVGGYGVLVPSEFAEESEALLGPQPDDPNRRLAGHPAIRA